MSTTVTTPADLVKLTTRITTLEAQVVTLSQALRVMYGDMLGTADSSADLQVNKLLATLPK